MKDLISRQAAIDALRYAQHRFTVADEAGGMGTVKWSEDVIYFAAAERVLTELSSVQPEYTEQDMREQFNAGYACGMHAAQPESKREWYMKGYRDAQANIVQCEDCKWRRNQNGTMAWIPCRALVTPDDFYCKYAERKEQ